jgi:hypothetical protein
VARFLIDWTDVIGQEKQKNWSRSFSKKAVNSPGSAIAEADVAAMRT